MQNKDNIEKLFKEKFENFEEDVNPHVWANVQGGISSSAGSASSVAAKFALGKILAGAAAVAGIAGSIWYFSGEENTLAENRQPAQGKTEVSSSMSDESFTAANISSEENASIHTNINKGFQNSTGENKISAAQDETGITAEGPIKDNSGIEDPVLPYKPKLGNAPKDDKGMSRIDQNYLKAKAAKENAAKSKSESANSAETSSDTESYSLSADEGESKSASDIALPNFFSPNGDGQFDVYSFPVENAVSISVVIYSQKTGELAARWSSLDGNWDGKLLNGSDAPAGVYFISVKAKRTDGSEISKNGTITLFR